MSSSSSYSTRLSIPTIRSKFNGRAVLPGDTDYDKARTVFYGDIDRRPAAILRALDADDVAWVIELARETGLELAVRSGGHSLAGHSVNEGGLVLDLSLMRELEIDVEQRTAWAQPGLTTGGYTAAAGAHGLATGFGDAATVAIGGITLGGGVGFLARKHGLTIDDLLAADLVTADGTRRRVDAENHPDLFWAIRGGGGNFGVATRFRFRLHDLPSIVGGMLILPATVDTITSFVREAEAAPDELTTIANVMPAPALPFVPAEQHGRLVIMGFMAYAGEETSGLRALAPFRALDTPLLDTVRKMSYREMFQPEQADYHPRAVAKTMFLERVERGTAEAMIEHLQDSNAFMAVAQLRVLGGAVARVPDDATAYAHRGKRIMVNAAALYQDAAEAPIHADWLARFVTALAPPDNSAYVNFVGNEGDARIRDVYPTATWNRLSAIKERYDPTNLFRGNHNITPGG